MNINHQIISFFEQRGFEVCYRLGERMGIRASKIRLFFIYSSFFTLGIPFLVYLGLAFLRRLKYMVQNKRSSVFDL